MQRVPIFKTILIQPDWKQFVINELPLLLLCPVGLVYAGLDEMPFRCIVLVVTILLSLCLLYRLAYLKRMIRLRKMPGLKNIIPNRWLSTIRL